MPPMLFVDGTFMKSRCKGTLLSATAKDGNNRLFPVAFAMVATENTDNGRWFLEKLKENATHERELMFISDRAGGLLSAFDDGYDKPPNYFCLYHSMKNLRTAYSGRQYSDNFKNHMCKLLKDVAYAPNRRFFDEAIHRFIAKGGDKAQHFLTDLPPQKWAVAFVIDAHRYDKLTSNAPESFNAWILDARSLPITFFFDSMRLRWLSTQKILNPSSQPCHNHWTSQRLLYKTEQQQMERIVILPKTLIESKQ